MYTGYFCNHSTFILFQAMEEIKKEQLKKWVSFLLIFSGVTFQQLLHHDIFCNTSLHCISWYVFEIHFFSDPLSICRHPTDVFYATFLKREHLHTIVWCYETKKNCEHQNIFGKSFFVSRKKPGTSPWLEQWTASINASHF